jgi:hypothetical protein
MKHPELESLRTSAASAANGSNGSVRPRAKREAESPAATHAPSSSGAVDTLARFVEDLGNSASRLFEVYSDRTRLSLRQSFQRMAIGAAFGACAGIWVGASTLAVLRGA